MYISPDVIDEIQNSVSIEQVVLETGYRTYGIGSKGISSCPKCGKDHTHIRMNPKKNLFNCFACGFKGNQFQWMMAVKGVSFQEAVISVATIGNLSVLVQEKKESHEKATIMDVVKEFYISQLRLNKKALLYMEGRGLKRDTIERFYCGYAPGGKSLKDYLNGEGFSDEELLRLRLIRRLKNGSVMDSFFSCIVIPDIRQSRVVDFYGRLINDQYKLHHFYLYGHKSLIGMQTIEPGEDLYICEAPIEALSVYQIFNAPAISIGGATKFSEYHLNQLVNYKCRPIIALNNDMTGIKNTLKIIEYFDSKGIESRVLTYKQYPDINLCLQHGYGANDFKIVESSTFYYNCQLGNIPKKLISRFLENGSLF